MPSEEKQPARKGKKTASPADFFISYNHADLQSAQILKGWLEQSGFTTFFQVQDFPVGSNFLERMNEGIKCERLLAVFTANYLNSPECMEELWAMRRRDPSGKDSRVVMTKLDDTPPPALLRARVYIDLVGLSGGQVKTKFDAAIAGLPAPGGSRKRRQDTGAVKASLPAPPSVPSFKVTQNGDGNIAVGGNFEQHIHEHRPSRRQARAKPPADVVTEEQAVRIKTLIDELIDLDRESFGAGQTEAALRGKWWGALYKHVPATSYKNFSQKKFQKAVKWAQGHKARMLTELRGEAPDEWRKNAYSRIKAHMRSHGLVKEVYYAELSRRCHIDPPFSSLTKLTDKELGRVYAAVGRDSQN